MPKAVTAQLQTFAQKILFLSTSSVGAEGAVAVKMMATTATSEPLKIKKFKIDQIKTPTFRCPDALGWERGVTGVTSCLAYDACGAVCGDCALPQEGQ